MLSCAPAPEAAFAYKLFYERPEDDVRPLCKVLWLIGISASLFTVPGCSEMGPGDEVEESLPPDPSLSKISDAFLFFYDETVLIKSRGAASSNEIRITVPGSRFSRYPHFPLIDKEEGYIYSRVTRTGEPFGFHVIRFTTSGANEVVDIDPRGSTVAGVEIHPDRDRLYAATAPYFNLTDYDRTETNWLLRVSTLQSRELLKEINVPPGPPGPQYFYPQRLTVSPSGRLAAVTVSYRNDEGRPDFGIPMGLFVLDLEKEKVIQVLHKAAVAPASLVFTPDERAVFFLTPFTSNDVYRFDIESGNLEKVVSLGEDVQANRIFWLPSRQQLLTYAYEGEQTTVYLIGPSGDVQETRSFDFAGRYAVIADDERVYFREWDEDRYDEEKSEASSDQTPFVSERFYVVDGATLELVEEIEVDGISREAFSNFFFRYIE